LQYLEIAMGKLSRGITYQANEHITAAKLYALIDTAVAQADAFPGSPSLYDVVMGDLLSTRAIHVASSPSSPTTNDLAVGSDGLLDRYTGSTWVDLDPGVTFFVTGSGICPEPLGVSTGVYAPSATASIRTTGLAYVRVNSPLSVGVDAHLNIAAAGATALSSTSSSKTDVLAIVVAADTASPLSGNALAILVH
jgi:hypothetical protein